MKISNKEYQKYSKQIILKKFGLVGQKKIINSKVLIFEVEIICETGRLRTFNNGDETIIEKYESSKEFKNYKLPKFFKRIGNKQNSSFLSIVKNAKDIISRKSNIISNGITASSSEELLDRIQRDENEAGFMPLGGSRLNQQQIDLLIKWKNS